ncbi:MAG: TetR/AcrR family transcriptional regulator [Mariprofundaceae bacterium]|nr:TetR/AcrR family transcriptional regulator [Mariprofundaceae bacterium]
MLNKVDTKTRIIHAAAELFHQQGFESVGLQKICAEAEVSKSSFYHFFASKDAVVVAVVQTQWAKVQQGFEQLLQQPLSPLQKLQCIFENVYGGLESMCAEHGKIFGCPFGNLASELAHSNPELRVQIQAIFDDMVSIFSTLITQAQVQDESEPHVDAEDAANALLLVMQGLSVVAKVYNDPLKIRKIGEHMVNNILGKS